VTLTYTDTGHRYRLDGRPVANVTTIIGGGLPKPALIDWSARVTAEWVADHVDEIPSLAAGGRDPMVAFLSRLHTEARNVAALRGTDVHGYAERLVHGEDVEVPHALTAHVDGYARFLDTFGPVPIITERPVASREHWYAGRPDLVALMGGETWLLDVKTSRSVYGDVSLQCAAYARAEFYVEDARDDAGAPIYAERGLPAIERIGVLHVTADGTDLYDLGAIGPAFAEFRACQTIYRGSTRRRNVIGEPLTVDELRAAS
jgi:hypothetical protein